MSPELTKIFGDGTISSTQAGRDFGITNDYVTLLCRRGKIKGFLVGRQWFVEKKSLESFLHTSRLESEARRRALSKQMQAFRAKAAQAI